MDGLAAYRLGRVLMRVGEASLKGGDQGRAPAGVAVILMDVVEHPDSPIGDIASRTGFPQGHVSTTVARLRERGLVETTPDAADRRRTLVRVAADFRKRVARRKGAPIEAALTEIAGVTDPEQVAEVVAALEVLADRLLRKHAPRPRQPAARRS
ncbi:MarR family winged helix-turn-helix transcriptional regulator [Actinoallomurus soli]|uniref:MarR family winged helix-turn-helix transcriptional regulator n=1 Tax=Actinoallomurus soli TaxID=2952535 RepID=UPI002093AAA0|nr:helix-turn-helix domain-containing protein [Actinoallomurus soli]MCO5968246.1 MarR family winged helix-turn-helix transcriptional regulator [Actinoallomurus soli]